MPKREWAEAALTHLQAGRSIEVTPRGHSMHGRISDGETVTLVPCQFEELKTGDVVLARIQGRRYSHLVLHLILDREGDQFLIGNNHGRLDGWIGAENIFGQLKNAKTTT